MDFQILFTNLTNPTLLFFFLGIAAALLKSDLEIPPTSSKFISLYLLFSIGFKGGQSLASDALSAEIFYTLLAGLVISACIPLYCFFILRLRLKTSDAAAVAACYGSVSAVTFVAAVTFLDIKQLTYGGHMVAVMALMEVPAIIISFILMKRFEEDANHQPFASIIHHSFTNGSVLMLIGSLFIGVIADVKQAEGIKPFTTDIFKGFLAIFLLDMGMLTAKRFRAFVKYGWFATLFAILIPVVNGSVTAWASGYFIEAPGNRFLLAILAASASYIAVPAAMRIAAPKADPGLYIPMALGVTFPFNISLGMPVYFAIISSG
jgi:hypothetical protein